MQQKYNVLQYGIT